MDYRRSSLILAYVRQSTNASPGEATQLAELTQNLKLLYTERELRKGPSRAKAYVSTQAHPAQANSWLSGPNEQPWRAKRPPGAPEERPQAAICVAPRRCIGWQNRFAHAPSAAATPSPGVRRSLSPRQAISYRSLDHASHTNRRAAKPVRIHRVPCSRQRGSEKSRPAAYARSGAFASSSARLGHRV